MKTIIIQGAMPKEVEPYIEFLGDCKHTNIDGYDFYEKIVGGKKYVVSQTQIGIMNATIATVASAITTNETVNAVGQHLTVSKISRNDEFEADLTGVDLMSKAGYNPLAMISLLNKISGNYIDILQTHPSGEKRLLNVYEYVEYNNPNAIKKGFKSDSYEKSLIVINQTVEKRKNNERLTKKYVKKQEKLLKKKEKRAKKMQSKSTIWDGYYTTLQ